MLDLRIDPVDDQTLHQSQPGSIQFADGDRPGQERRPLAHSILGNIGEDLDIGDENEVDGHD